MDQQQQQQPSWYEVLGVAQDASTETIKQAFRAAALRLHPDKAAAAASSSGGSVAVGAPAAAPVAADDYLLVQQAWEVLQDTERRAGYDRQLALSAASRQLHINESVPLGDMQPETVEGQACYGWPCRCGGSYLLVAEEADSAAAAGGEAELIVPCSTCSLHIRVLPA